MRSHGGVRMSDNYEVVMQEVDRRVNALIAKGLTEIDATSKVFRDDRQLYEKYTQASAEAPERTAPTRGINHRGPKTSVKRS